MGSVGRRRRYADRAGFVVRVLAVGSHEPVGTGFVVAESHLVTCAHVVNAALSRDPREQAEPDPAVRVPVDFPILGDADGAPVRFCRVVRWLPPPLSGTAGDDIAGLALAGEDLPLAAGPARLPEDPRFPLGGEVHVFGHPTTPPRLSGSWASARVLGRVGGGMLQVDSNPAAAVRLQPGYSGSPLVLAGDNGDCVVGMLSVASTRETSRDAYGVPVDRLVRAWPEVLAGIPPSPYPGLRSFTAADEAVFVGREEDTDHLLDLVENDTLALVVGPSGIGKSSLVDAGLVPRWRAEGGVGVTVRPGPGSSSPLDRVLSDVEVALRAATGVEEWPVRADAPAAGLAAAVSRRAETVGTRVLVHLDQFEELLGATSGAERRALVDTLLPGPHDRSPACRVVVTIRADFLPVLLELPGQGARLRHRILALSPMGVAALERAVTEPARARGVEYEAGLAGQIAADASGGPGSLPLMEFTLAQLWESQRGRCLTFADYRGFGGVAGAVNRHAERCYERFRAEGLASQVKAVMLALVRTRGGAAEATGRAVPRRRFDATGLLVEELCRYRLLVVEPAVDDRGVDEPLVRLAHESLVRSWSRLAGWVDEDAEFQRWLATMEERTADDELLADSRLGPAEHWLAERRADVPDEVVRLVERSRSAWRQRVAELEAARAAAEAAAARAEARRLAVAAELVAVTGGRGGPLPLTLAVESVRTCWTLEGDTALRHALRTAPRLVTRLPVDDRDPGPARLRATGDQVVRHLFAPGSADRVWTQLLELDFDGPGWREVHQEEGRVRFTPDGRAVLRTDARRVTLVDIRTGAVLAEDTDRRPVVSAQLSEDGTRLVVVRGERTSADHDQLVLDSTVRVTDIATGARCHVFAAGALRGELTFNRDATLLAATAQWLDKGWQARTTVFDLTDERVKPVEIEYDGTPSGLLAFSPDGTLLVGGANRVDSCGDAHSGGIEAHDLRAGGTRSYRLSPHLPVAALSFDPDGTRLAVALGDVRRRRPGAGQVVDAPTGRELFRVHHDYPVTTAAFNADGSRVVFAGERSARVFAAAGGTEFFQVDHEHDLAGVAFHPDGRRLRTLTVDLAGTATAFESRTTDVARIDYDPLADTHLSGDATTAFVTALAGPYTARTEKRVPVVAAVDTMTAARREVSTHPGNVRVLASSTDGAHLVLGTGGVARVHDVVRGGEPREIAHPGCPEVLFAAVTADGRRVVTVAGFANGYRDTGPSGDEQAVTTAAGLPFPTPSGRPARLPPGTPRARLLRVSDIRNAGVLSTVDVVGAVVAVSPDGALAAMRVHDEDSHLSHGDTGGTGHGLVAIVATGDGTERATLRALTGPSTVAFGPRGDWFAALRERTLVVHATSDGRHLWSVDLDLHPHTVSTGPAGSRIAVYGYSDSAGSVLAVLDAEDGTRLGTYATNHWGDAPAFSTDDRRIAVLRDRSACVVDIDRGTELCVVEHDSDPIFRAAFVGTGGTHLLTVDRRSMRVSVVDTEHLLPEAATRLARPLTEAERRRYLTAPPQEDPPATTGRTPGPGPVRTADSGEPL